MLNAHQKILADRTYQLLENPFPLHIKDKRFEGQFIKCPLTGEKLLSLWNDSNHYICMDTDDIKKIMGENAVVAA